MTKKAMFIEDQHRGTPAWYEALISGYHAQRNRVAKPFWDLARECYEQEQFTGYRYLSRYELDQVQPPRVYGLVHQIESQVYNRNPKFFASPLTPRQEDLATFAETSLNVEWKRDARLQKEMRLCVRDATLTGWGWILSGVEGDYAAMAAERAKRNKIAEKAKGNIVAQQQLDMAIEAIEAGKDSLTVPPSETSYEMDDRVWMSRVCSRRIDPDDIVVDPNATSPDDWRWVGRRIFADYDAVMANDLFKNKEDLEPSTVAAGFDVRTASARFNATGVAGQRDAAFNNGAQTAAPLQYQYIELFELFVRQQDGSWDMKVFAKGHKKFLREVKAPYDLGCPYKLLRWNELGTRIFAVSDVQPILTHVIEEREIRTRMHDAFVRGAVDAYAFDRSVLNTEEAIRPVTLPGVGLMIPLNVPPGSPVGNTFTLLPRNPQTSEAIAYLNIIERNIQEGTGLGANQLSQALKSETSATEAAEIAKHSNARGVAKYASFNDFVALVAHDRLKLTAQFYSTDMIAMLAGTEAAKAWVKEKFTIEDIQWGLNITVEVGSMQPTNDAAKAQSVMAAIQSAKMDPIAAQMVNLPELWSEYFKLLGYSRGSKFLQPNVDPAMIAQQYAQMALMGAGGGMGGTGGGAAPSGEAGMAQMGGGELA